MFWYLNFSFLLLIGEIAFVMLSMSCNLWHHMCMILFKVFLICKCCYQKGTADRQSFSLSVMSLFSSLILSTQLFFVHVASVILNWGRLVIIFSITVSYDIISYQQIFKRSVTYRSATSLVHRRSSSECITQTSSK